MQGWVAASYNVEKMLGLGLYPERRTDPCARGLTDMKGMDDFLEALAREGVSRAAPLKFSFFCTFGRVGRKQTLSSASNE
jgi:hypothetical protein